MSRTGLRRELPPLHMAPHAFDFVDVTTLQYLLYLTTIKLSNLVSVIMALELQNVEAFSNRRCLPLHSETWPMQNASEMKTPWCLMLDASLPGRVWKRCYTCREMAMMQNDFWRNNGAAQQRPRPQLCPRCGQPNYKHANNNSITCPSCTCRFCFLCREILQRGTRHFSGTGGCRQHS